MIKIFQFAKQTTLALAAAGCVLVTTLDRPVAAQEGVTISQEAIDAVLTSCTSATDCAAAIEALVAQVAAANPGVPPAAILTAVLTTVTASYNAGTLPAAVAATVISAVATVATSVGAPQVVAAVEIAAAAVAAGEPIDEAAVAEAAGSPT